MFCLPSTSGAACYHQVKQFGEKQSTTVCNVKLRHKPGPAAQISVNFSFQFGQTSLSIVETTFIMETSTTHGEIPGFAKHKLEENLKTSLYIN